ncbi:MAG: endonuclease/exonuclease/phosphatase family protein [Acidimicrobiales bacterium]|nr:endonuclease/exonuclease/phosphatase family protein [Acidimicrobiales bacterium]
MEDLKALISNKKPDVVLLTEIIPKAQKNQIYEAEMKIQGYETFTNFKFTERDLGASGIRGVAIYVNEELETEEIKLKDEYKDHLWLEVKLRNQDRLLCGCIYRSPSKENSSTKDSTEKVCNVISEALQRNDTRLLICGDFNYPEIDWNSDYVNNKSVEPFITSLQKHHLHQHVCKLTRYREGQEPSLLDLILTTEEGMIESLEHNPGLGESDHECLNFTLNCYKDTPVTRSIPNYYKADYITIRNRLEPIEWIPKLRGGFTEAYQIFVKELEKAMEGCIPVRINRRKKKSIYMSRDSLKLQDLKAKLWKRYKNSGTHYDRLVS